MNCPSGAVTFVCASGPSGAQTFTGQGMALTITGGSGSYTYAWTAAGDGNGTWTTGGIGSTYTPSVSRVLSQEVSTANYTCTVTDTVSAKQATSNAIAYQWFNSKGGG